MITPAYESFVNDVCYDMAQEGANININATYNKAAKEGTSIIREAKALMEKKQYDPLFHRPNKEYKYHDIYPN